MNKLHKRIAINQERYIKRLAKQVPTFSKDDPKFVRAWYDLHLHFSPAAAAHTVMKMKCSKVQRLARYLRKNTRLYSVVHGSYFSVKWPMYVYVAITGPNEFTEAAPITVLREYSKYI